MKRAIDKTLPAIALNINRESNEVDGAAADVGGSHKHASANLLRRAEQLSDDRATRVAALAIVAQSFVYDLSGMRDPFAGRSPEEHKEHTSTSVGVTSHPHKIPPRNCASAH